MRIQMIYMCMRRNAYNLHFDLATACPTLVFIEPFSLKTRNANAKVKMSHLKFIDTSEVLSTSQMALRFSRKLMVVSPLSQNPS